MIFIWPSCWTLPAAYGVVLYGRIGHEELAVVAVPALFPAVRGQRQGLASPMTPAAQ